MLTISAWAGPMTKAARIALFYTAIACSLASFPHLASATAQTRQAAPYTVVETGRSFARLQDAVDAIGNGRGTIRFAPARFSDCAVQEGGKSAYVAEVPSQAILEGSTPPISAR